MEGTRGEAPDFIWEQGYMEQLEHETQNARLLMPRKNGEVVCLKCRGLTGTNSRR